MILTCSIDDLYYLRERKFINNILLLMNNCQYEVIPGFPFFDVDAFEYQKIIERNKSPILLYRSKEGTPYAVKQMKINNITLDQSQNRQAILKILFQNQRPNIINYIAACIKKQIICYEVCETVLIQMQYYEKNLLQYISERKINKRTFTSRQIKDFIFQMVDILSHIQGLGVAHRDIKPHNIMIHYEYNKLIYKLCDFEDSIIVSEKTTQFIPITTLQYTCYSLVKEIQTGQKLVFDPFKLDAFALGLTILKMSSLGRYADRERLNHFESKESHQKFLKQARRKYVKIYKDSELNLLVKLLLQTDQFKRDDANTVKIKMNSFQKQEQLEQQSMRSSILGIKTKKSSGFDELILKQKKLLLAGILIQLIVFVFFSIY